MFDFKVATFVWLLNSFVIGFSIFDYQKTNQIDVWSKADKSPVKLELFYESLCPGCRNFITNHLYKTWKKLQKSGTTYKLFEKKFLNRDFFQELLTRGT